MAVKIRPIVLKDAASYRTCWETVANERRYIVQFEAPPLSQVRANWRQSLRKKTPFLVAVDEERVVGFAAVYSSDLPSLKRTGNLGMFLLPEYRGLGLGTRLLAGVLKLSRGRFDSVMLDVFAKNKIARKLYKKMGFVLCGRMKQILQGLAYGYDDLLIMQKQMSN